MKKTGAGQEVSKLLKLPWETQSQQFPKINKQHDFVTKDGKVVLVLKGQNDGKSRVELAGR